MIYLFLMEIGSLVQSAILALFSAGGGTESGSQVGPLEQ